MSPVTYHFQLDQDKPDEDRAMEMLQEWLHAGWDLQKIIVKALLTLDENYAARDEPNPASTDDMREIFLQMQEHTRGTMERFNQLLYQMQNLVEQLQEPPVPAQQELPLPEKEEVSTAFVASVSKTIKPGIRLEDTSDTS